MAWAGAGGCGGCIVVGSLGTGAGGADTWDTEGLLEGEWSWNKAHETRRRGTAGPEECYGEIAVVEMGSWVLARTWSSRHGVTTFKFKVCCFDVGRRQPREGSATPHRPRYRLAQACSIRRRRRSPAYGGTHASTSALGEGKLHAWEQLQGEGADGKVAGARDQGIIMTSNTWATWAASVQVDTHTCHVRCTQPSSCVPSCLLSCCDSSPVRVLGAWLVLLLACGNLQEKAEVEGQLE